jgi:hypothetical protein
MQKRKTILDFVEVIEIRSLSDQKTLMGLELPELLKELAEEREVRAIAIYRHGELETDWSLHLRFTSDSDRVGRSQVGFRLVSLLREFGIVHHGLWKEMRRCTSTGRGNNRCRYI